MILLTGATGLLGTRIAIELSLKGFNIRALKRKDSSTAFFEKVIRFYHPDNADQIIRSVEWVNGDILDLGALEDAMQNITQVYHAAAMISFHPEDRKQLIQTNIEGTANVVNIALDAGVKKFCHISSIASLGKTLHGEPVTENTWWKNDPSNSWYAISKYGAEREAWRATEEGMDVVILNPSFIIGPGDPGKSSAAVFSLAKKGISFYTNGQTGYVDAGDVARAAVMLMQSDIKNERFILSSENLTYRQFLDSVLTAMGQQPTRRYASPFLTGLAWRGEKWLSRLTARRALITKETAEAAHRVTSYDGTRICTVLPFEYKSAAESIRETAAFFRQ